MADVKKYLDADGLLYVKQKIAASFVAKETGKGLSTNDYTDAEKTKLTGIEEGAEENIIENVIVNGTTATIANKTATVTIETGAIDSISVNGTAQTIDANKNVDITVPTNNNQLTNGAGYQTEAEVQTLIDDALEDITGIDFEIVETLPETGTKGVIYLVSNSGTGTNTYDEYIWLSTGNKWEKIGTTDIDLSGYVRTEDLVAITNAEIDAIFGTNVNNNDVIEGIDLPGQEEQGPGSGYTLTSDTTYQEGKTYYSEDGDGFYDELIPGRHYQVGDAITGNVYEAE